MARTNEIAAALPPAAGPPRTWLPKAVAIGAVILVCLIITGCTAYKVQETERAVTLRNGAVTGVAEPGLHLRIPIIDTYQRISIQQWSRVYDEMETYSKDQQLASLRVSVTYHVPPSEVVRLYTNHGSIAGMVDTLLDRRVPDLVKPVFGQFNAASVIQERVRFAQQVQDAVVDGIDGPVVIDSVQVEDIAFSAAYEQSVEARMQAEVEVQRRQQELAQQQIQAQITVTQAQAQADSALAQARAQAEAVRLQGEAQAAAIEARGAALANNPLLISLTAAERWNGVLPSTMVPGGALPFLNLQAPGQAPGQPAIAAQ